MSVLELFQDNSRTYDVFAAFELLSLAVYANEVTKTVEVTRLQVGKQTLEIYVIVSTLPEAELLEPFLLESRQNGKAINASSLSEALLLC